jgi:serine/threonine-protein kinase RsbW
MTGQTGTASQARTSTTSSPALRSWRVFPGKADQLRLVRQWVRDLLPPCEVLDDVLLVVSELGANAVCHTASGQGGQFVIEIAWAAETVRVAVADEGGPLEPRIIEAPHGESGRGLQAVCELSASTGFSGDVNGRLVWADVPWAARGGMPPQDSGWDQTGAAGLEVLRLRFPQVPAWFGQSTKQWWAMVKIDGEHRLVGAASPVELVTLLAAVRERRRTAEGYDLDPAPASAWQAWFAGAMTEAV